MSSSGKDANEGVGVIPPSELVGPDDPESVLGQAVDDNDWQSVHGILRRYGYETFILSGRLDDLNRLLERVPETVILSDCSISYLRGMSLLLESPERAASALVGATRLAEKSGDERCLVQSLLGLMAIYSFANRILQLQDAVRRIESIASYQTDPWFKAAATIASFSLAVNEEDLNRAIMLNKVSGQSAIDPLWRTYYLMCGALLFYRVGDFPRAKEIAEEAVSQPFFAKNRRWVGMTYEMLSGIYGDSGDNERAVRLAEELIVLGKEYGIPRHLAYGHRRLAQVYLREGNSVQARRQYEASRINWTESGNELMPLITDLELLLLRSVNGENPSGLFERSQVLLSKIQETPSGQGYREYALLLSGVMATDAHQYETAREWLLQSASSSEQKGARHLLAGTHLQLARLLLFMGNEATARDYLRKSLSAAESLGIDCFWDWHSDALYCMCRLALMEGIHTEWAAHILKRWFPEKLVRDAAYTLTHENKTVRALSSEFLAEWVRKSGSPVVHVTLLGRFQVFVNGEIIPDSRWKTQKACTLFKLLVIDRGRRPKEDLIDELWPDFDASSGDANLRVALSHVRQALGRGCGDLVLLNRGMVYLNPHVEIHTDCDIFLETAKEALKEDSGRVGEVLQFLLEASQLYRGDLLPDDQYNDSITTLRRHCQKTYLTILGALAKHQHGQGNFEAALRVCRSFLAREPGDETIARLAMTILYTMGRRHEAVDVYREMRRALERDYGLTPSEETQHLYEKIRVT